MGRDSARKSPAWPRKPPPRSGPLEDKPCMLIFWLSKTRSQVARWSSVRNYRAILLVYVSVSVPRVLRGRRRWVKGTSNQRLDGGRVAHADVTRDWLPSAPFGPVCCTRDRNRGCSLVPV